MLRRPPPGATADAAHDDLWEYRVMSGLRDTPVRVPDVVHACEDESVLGSEFYVMERVDGVVLRDSEPASVATPEARRQLGGEFVDALAELHAVDYEAAGLGDLGRPAGYLERQVERWRAEYD